MIRERQYKMKWLREREGEVTEKAEKKMATTHASFIFNKMNCSLCYCMIKM